jgi:porin
MGHVRAVAAAVLLGLAAVPAAAEDPPKAPPAGEKAVPAPAGAKAGDAKAPVGEAKTAPPKAGDPKAPPAAEPSSKFTLKDFLEWEHLTGEWGGARDRWEDKGIEFEILYLQDITKVERGGANPDDTSSRYFLDIHATADLHEIWRKIPEGLELTVAYWQMGGENGSADAGSFNEVSGYESPHRKELAELYLEYGFRGSWRAKVGKMDASYEFAWTEYGNDFMNLGVAFPPNLLGIPVYPDPSGGAALFWEPEKGVQMGAGFYDGALQSGEVTGAVPGLDTGERGVASFWQDPADNYVIAEVGYVFDRPLRVAAGFWNHSGDFVRFDGRIQDGTSGIYASAEGRLHRSTHIGKGDDGEDDGDGDDEDDDEREPGTYLTVSYTQADEDVSPVERHYVAALVFQGLCTGRPRDSAGLAYIYSDLTDEMPGIAPSEQVIEAYYRIQVTPFLGLQPGVQWIGNPGGVDGNDAFILGLRITLDF